MTFSGYYSVATAGFAVGGVVVAGAGYALVAETTGSAGGEFSTREYIQPVPVTEPLREWETPDGLEITLPSGAVYEHEIHDGYERKHGWEQIKELPGIHQPKDVREIVRAPNAIEEDGRYDLIIGDNPNGDGQIILRVLEGLIVSAGQLIEDPTGHKVEIDRNDDHIYDQRGHPTYDEVEQAIRNPTQIWENNVPHGVERHFIAQIGDKWVIVRTYWDGTKWTFSTGVYMESKSDVKEYIQDRDLTERVYGEKL